MAIEIKYHFTKDQVKNGYRSAWHRTVMDLFDLIAQYSQELIVAGPNFDGDLLRSLNQYFADDMTGYIGYTAPYAKAVEFGSRPHWPPPDALYDWCRRKLGKNGPTEVPIDRLFALAFGKAKPRYAAERTFVGVYRKIGTLGTEPQPYLRPATEMANPKVGGLYTKHLAREGLA